jgi:hypothetical protein
MSNSAAVISHDPVHTLSTTDASAARLVAWMGDYDVPVGYWPEDDREAFVEALGEWMRRETGEADTSTITIKAPVCRIDDADLDGVDLDPGDWIELADASYGAYDRGQILAVGHGHVDVAWQGAANRETCSASELGGRVHVYPGQPRQWAHEWPACPDEGDDGDED